MGVDKIRVSVGSAAVLGLRPLGKMEIVPSTCYLMTYKEGACSANCGFCPQARSSKSSKEKLSRVTWPVFEFKTFLTKLKYLAPTKQFKRICIQALNYPENFKDLIFIVKNIRGFLRTPISVAIPPLSKEKSRELKAAGVNRVGIALDGATKEVFTKIKGSGVKGPYTWEKHFEAINQSLEIFGENNVSTHIIIGLGETEKEVVGLLEKLGDLKVIPSLFAFTPIKGTGLEGLQKPELLKYRRLQLARYLVLHEEKKLNDFTFNSRGKIIQFDINKRQLWNFMEENGIFRTRGCPNCDRPYYTSRPSGPLYNYPRKLEPQEKEEIYNSLQKFVR
ncbi:MAG: Biotin synthase [Promethearchaeota archaeon]|nr:MAG: Biotin synthase [Candidatus Lokiarchaeota archaeon]